MTAPVRLAVLGDPLRYTRSPDLHRAGALALGLACESHAIRTSVEQLPVTLARLAAEGFTGCNVTMPLKLAALGVVPRATRAARRARSVNTVTFLAEGMEGDTTDGAGFLDLVASLDRDIATARVVLLGAGGSARSLALAVAEADGPAVRVVSRIEPLPDEAWGGALGERWGAWGSATAEAMLASADVLVNCTPLGGREPVGSTDPAALPAAPERIAQGTLVVDLVYGEGLTPWVLAARAHGLEAVDGLGLLVHQARHSLARWFGRDVPLAPLAAAVGWPR